jgi:hypothetical protein
MDEGTRHILLILVRHLVNYYSDAEKEQGPAFIKSEK